MWRNVTNINIANNLLNSGPTAMDVFRKTRGNFEYFTINTKDMEKYKNSQKPAKSLVEKYVHADEGLIKLPALDRKWL